jgi:hypothetical protein
VEGGTTSVGDFSFVDSPGERTQASFELRNAHLAGLEIYVKEGAKLPGLIAENTIFLLQACV